MANFKTSLLAASPDLLDLCRRPPLRWHRNIKVHGWFCSFLTQKGKPAACANSCGTKPEYSIRRQTMCRKSLRWPNIYCTNETPPKKFPLKITWSYRTFPHFFSAWSKGFLRGDLTELQLCSPPAEGPGASSGRGPGGTKRCRTPRFCSKPVPQGQGKSHSPSWVFNFLWLVGWLVGWGGGR